MCDVSFDDGDWIQVHGDVEYTARKDYRCDTCRVAITAGTRYRRYAYLQDGKWYTERQCVECAKIATAFDIEHCCWHVPSYTLELIESCVGDFGDADSERWRPGLESIKERACPEWRAEDDADGASP